MPAHSLHQILRLTFHLNLSHLLVNNCKAAYSIAQQGNEGEQEGRNPGTKRFPQQSARRSGTPPSTIQKCAPVKNTFVFSFLPVSVEMGSVKHKAASQINNPGQVLSEAQEEMSRREEQLLLMTEKVVTIH